jgi:hypothetical protein
LVTVKVYEPGARPVMVVVVPVPVVIAPPGLLVIVHVPVAGKPFNTTLPVATEQVGCVIDPIVGAPGKPVTLFTTIGEDEAEMHPDGFITV